MADYDVIVIGAGLGGLSLGALMAKRGKKTLIVEQSPRVGGYCSTFERDGFRFDLGASIIEIIDVIEGCFTELGTSVFNEVEMVPLEPIYTIKFKDGSEMRYPTSKEETADEFRKISPEDAEGWLKYADYMQGFLDTALTGFFLEPANTLIDMLKMFMKTPKLLSFMPLFNMNYQDVIRKYFKHPKIQEALAFQSNFMGLPPELCPGHMTMLPWAEHTGFYYSKGGHDRHPRGPQEDRRAAWDGGYARHRGEKRPDTKRQGQWCDPLVRGADFRRRGGFKHQRKEPLLRPGG